MKRLSVALTLLLVADSGARAAVLQVEVPAHAEWCQTIVIPDMDILRTPEGQQGVFLEGSEPIVLCARPSGLARIGTPYVHETASSKGKPKELRMTFCAVVPSGASVCDGIAARQVPAVEVLAAVCKQGESAACRTELEQALKGEPWKLDAAAIGQTKWRFAQASEGSASAAVVVDAFTGATFQVGKRTDGDPAAPAAGFVVVAAPVPVAVAEQGVAR